MRNRYEVEGNIVKVYFNNCDDHFIIGVTSLQTLLDIRCTWHKDKDGYARGTVNGKSTTVHRLLTNCPKGMVADHRNRNRLDNRLSNLRVVTNAQNLQNRNLNSNNRTGYKNVHFDNLMQTYQVVVQGKNYGRYDDVEEANRVAIKARKENLPYAVD